MLFLFRTSQVTKCGTLTAEATSPAPLLGFFFSFLATPIEKHCRSSTMSWKLNRGHLDIGKPRLTCQKLFSHSLPSTLASLPTVPSVEEHRWLLHNGDYLPCIIPSCSSPVNSFLHDSLRIKEREWVQPVCILLYMSNLIYGQM